MDTAHVSADIALYAKVAGEQAAVVPLCVRWPPLVATFGRHLGPPLGMPMSPILIDLSPDGSNGQELNGYPAKRPGLRLRLGIDWE